MTSELTVNGTATKVEVASDTPLLWVLRDVLNYKGTKFGCGAGLCGASTVLIDGRAVRSCQTRVSTVKAGRCGTYSRIRQAIHRAAGATTATAVAVAAGASEGRS